MAEQYGYISENLKRIRSDIAEAEAKYRGGADCVRLMAVTKTVPAEAVNHAVMHGVTLLGENRVQEYLEKKDAYLPQAEVHFIGHLQTNKVKYIIGNVSLIHSVDSVKLGAEINRLAAAKGIVCDVLAEVNIGGEESKSGISPQELPALLEQLSEMKNISLRGLMTIPPPGSSEKSFEAMERLFRDTSAKYPAADILSMGMSADYKLAVKYGSTIVRIGTGLFGARDYSKK